MMFFRDSVPFWLRVPECGMWKTVKQASPASMRSCSGRGHSRPSGVHSESSSIKAFRIMSGMYTRPQPLGAS